MINNRTQEFTAEWKSPSNLAIVKYWGRGLFKTTEPKHQLFIKKRSNYNTCSARPSKQGVLLSL